MPTYTATIVDHPMPWNLSRTEKREIAETETFEACDDEAAIEEVEDWGVDISHEHAQITLKRGSRTIYKQGF